MMDYVTAHNTVTLPVSLACGVPVYKILKAHIQRTPAARARQISMYLMHTLYGMTDTAIGRVFEVNGSSVRSACHKIEDQRDDRNFDAWLEELELTLTAVIPCDRRSF